MDPSTAPILGVTGSVAAGKSALSSRLGALGAHVIDVDGLGHQALATDSVRDAVFREFGRGVLAPDGSLDRRALARQVFTDAAARKRLEAIVHPVVRRQIVDEIAAARAGATPLVVVDCALLFESGLDSVCDVTLFVDAPEDVRMRRARTAHGWDEAEVRRRMAAQLAPDEKRRKADQVVVNDGDEARLEEQARAVFEAVLRSPRAPAARRTSS